MLQCDTELIEQHTGRYKGGKAFIVLGGWSGRGWQYCAERIQPDVIIGVNGTNQVVPDLDYWLIVEARACKNLPTFQLLGPKYRLVHTWAYYDLKDTTDVIRITRLSESVKHRIELDTLLNNSFDIRRFGQGLLAGDLMQNQHVLKFSHRCGTVAVQAMHWASILGVDEIHTIGLDLYFHEGIGGNHHWYPDRQYTEENMFWKKGMFTSHDGLPTSFFWLESAHYLRKLDHKVLRPAGIRWIDHSDGLLQRLDPKYRYIEEVTVCAS